MYNHTMNNLALKIQIWELQFDIANWENRNLFININPINTTQCSVCLDALKVNGVSTVDGMILGTWQNGLIIH